MKDKEKKTVIESAPPENLEIIDFPHTTTEARSLKKIPDGMNGRPKGSKDKVPNSRKVRNTVKGAIKDIFDMMMDAGEVEEWAKQNPTEFMKIAAKLIPQEIDAKVETVKQVFMIGDKRIEF